MTAAMESTAAVRAVWCPAMRAPGPSLRSRFVALVAVVVTVGLAFAAPADAARTRPLSGPDTTPPVITHVPPGTCPAAPAPCSVLATIVDDSGVFDPTLLFRIKGGAAFDRVPMKKGDSKAAANDYVGVIPAAIASAGDVEYLIEAFDVEGNGPARAGTEGAPLVLVKPAAVVVLPPPPPPPPVVEDDNTGLVVGVVAVSVAVAVVAAAGIGIAVYALRPPANDTVTVSVEGPSPFAAVAP